MNACRILVLTVSLAAIGQAQTLAEEKTDTLEEVVVISSRIATPMRQVGTSVSVLTEAEIANHGNLALVDVLRQLPAIASSNNGGAGKTTTLRIRGEEGYRTLTIFDGIRLADPSGTQVGPNFEHILSSGIGRVEVLRGPQGLSYGADAGGVVNITSRPAVDGFFANVDIQTGEFDSSLFSGNFGGGDEVVDFFLSISDFRTEGFNARASDVVLNDDDGYDNTTIHARIGFDLSDRLRVDVVHRDTEGDAQFDGCFAGTTVHDCSSTYDLEATRLSASYTTENFTHTASYASTKTDRENFALGVSSFTADGEINRIEYLGTATNLPGFDLVFGADHEEALNSGEGRDSLGLHVEYLSDFSDNIFVTAGLRYDDNEDFGTNTSFRLSGAYLLHLDNGATLKFKSSLGSGFRAPSPFEIAYNAGPYAFPPSSLISLSQEESQGYEIGIEYSNDDLKLEAVYFDQDVQDAIFFDLAGFSGYLQDKGKSTSKGIELSAKWAINENLTVTANYTYNDTERPNGLQRLRRPENLLNLGLSYLAMDEKLRLNAFHRFSDNAIDEFFGSVVDLPDFDVLDLSASYRINESLQIFGRIENATDEDYQEVTDYNGAPRAAYVGLKMSIGR